MSKYEGSISDVWVSRLLKYPKADEAHEYVIGTATLNGRVQSVALVGEYGEEKDGAVGVCLIYGNDEIAVDPLIVLTEDQFLMLLDCGSMQKIVPQGVASIELLAKGLAKP